MRRLRQLGTGMLGVALLAGAARGAAAQGEGVVAGVVATQGTVAPLPGAQVGVEGTTLGALTDAQGRFRITGVTGPTVQLSVRRIGYRPVTETVQVGATDIRIVVTERAVELNEIVVTGTAGATEQRAIGNAVSQIDAAAVVQTQPVRTFQDLVNGRATGVAIIPGSGQVGSGSRIRVRGASSLSLANDPLIYVDGVRVDNTQASGPTNQAFGSQSISRWNDFDPDDIESIEVIKGPAAATLYGTEAANGVIQIITKRGAQGRPTWNVSVRQGANWFQDPEDRLFTNYAAIRNPTDTARRDTVSLDIVEQEQARGTPIFRTGQLQDYSLNVSGGTGPLRYYIGGNAERNEGAERVNRLSRNSGRVNLTLTPSEKWDANASVGYMAGRTYLPLESGGGGATWASYFSSPAFGDTATRGFRSGPPEIYYSGFDLFQDVNRFTGSITFNHRPASWFTQRLVFGTDQLDEDNQEVAEVNLNVARFFNDLGPPGNGYIEVSTRAVSYNTIDYGGSFNVPISSDLVGTTSIGGQYYSRVSRVRGFYGEGFPSAGFRSLQSTTTQRLTNDDRLENTTIGVYVQQQMAWRDRLFVTGAVRADDNSGFGENFDLVYYPKLSASWVVSEEPFWRLPAIDALKLRAAYGQSGQQPAAFAALRTFSSGGAGTVTPSAIGNPNLGPERSAELELGFDAGMLNDRLGVEVTYFRGQTTDAILERAVPPSVGFPGVQLFNAGRVNRQGLELLVRGQPLQRENAALDLTFSIGTNTNEIQSLGAGVTSVSPGGPIEHRVGYAVGSWFDRRVVSADFDSTGTRAINVMCDDGEGGTVACASAPRVFLGNTIPKTEGSFNAVLTLFRNLRLGTLLDFKGGYNKLDGNRRVRCNIFNLCRENFYPQEFDPLTIAEAQGGTSYVSGLIFDSGYAKLREVSATYSLPQQWAGAIGASRASITVAGRNLYTWTDYPGLEPEASFLGGGRGGYGQWEQNVLPQLNQFVTSVNLSF